MTWEDSHLREWAARALPDHPWRPRRGLDRLGPGAETALAVRNIDAALADPMAFAVVDGEGSTIRAVTFVRPRQMESDAFGFGVAGIDLALCPTDTTDRIEVLRANLSQALAEAGERGMTMIVLKVDAGDAELLVAAQHAGYLIYDVSLNFLAEADRWDQPVPPPPGVRIDVYNEGIDGVLAPDDLAALSARTTAWEQNHHRADPRVPIDAIERFYGQWMANIGAGTWCDQLVVASADGQVIGIHSAVMDKELLAATGISLLTDVWTVARSRGRGVSSAMLSAAIHHAPPGCRHIEWESQARNTSVIRAAEFTKTCGLIRGAYTMHAWTDGA